MQTKPKHSSIIFLFLLFVSLLLAVFLFSLNSSANESSAKINVIYNQNHEPDKEIVNLINSADKYIYFAIYTLTKENIVDALIAAKLRGVEVKGVLDFNQSIIAEEKPSVNKLKKYNIPLEIPFKEQGLMHIKMLITEKSYASGSYNWTVSGTTLNDEVLEYGDNEKVRNLYLKVFEDLYKKYTNSLVLLP
jgi:phosphatidylserine/phosphatidylglycerophosphate/cardiolipin synthase-like enzyme